MTIYTLSHGPLKLDVSDQGGVIEGFWRDTTPLLSLVVSLLKAVPTTLSSRSLRQYSL